MKYKLIITIVFALVGMYMIGTLIHEEVHKYDLRNIAYNGSICLLDTDMNGDYDFTIPQEAVPWFKENEIKFELRAYIIEGLFELICVYIIVTLAFEEVNKDGKREIRN